MNWYGFTAFMLVVNAVVGIFTVHFGVAADAGPAFYAIIFGLMALMTAALAAGFIRGLS